MTAPRPAEGPDREAHTLAACPGGGCQAGHVNDVGEPVDAESAAILRLTKTSSGFWVCEHDRYWRHCPERGCIYVRDDLLPTPPAPAEGPDREALRDFLRLSMSEANVQHALALLPTPPAPGGGEGLRADPVETLCAEWEHLAASGRAPSWSVPASLLRAALAARDTDQGAGALRRSIEALLDSADPDLAYQHVNHAADDGDPDCGACWVADLRAALAGATPEADRG
jgi:hypothetical protein